MATVSLRLNEQEELFFRNYAKMTGKTLSELFKTALAEQIEDQTDLNIYREAMKEYQADTETLSLAEMYEELGI